MCIKQIIIQETSYDLTLDFEECTEFQFLNRVKDATLFSDCVVVQLSCNTLAVLTIDLMLIKYLPIAIDSEQLNSHVDPEPTATIYLSTNETHLMVAANDHKLNIYSKPAFVFERQIDFRNHVPGCSILQAELIWDWRRACMFEEQKEEVFAIAVIVIVPAAQEQR